MSAAFALFTLLFAPDPVATVKPQKSRLAAEFKLAHAEYGKTLDTIATNITNTLSSEEPTATEVIRATLAYVHTNSLHLIDEEYKTYAFQIPYVLKRMLKAQEGDGEGAPHLSCGPRAYSMQSILRKFGIYSRLVQIYSDDFDQPQGHRFLEVFNPDVNLWETWDPDFGVTYASRKTGRSVDVMSLVFSANKNEFVPVGIEKKGWKETKTEHLLKSYFESVLFEETTGMKNSTLLVNGDLFDMSKVFPGTGSTFREWAHHYYEFPRIMVLAGDSGLRTP